MSGGAFDHQQYRLGEIAGIIEDIIYENRKPDENNWFYDFDEHTIAEFKKAIEHLKIAQIYAHRIDWLVSGDDGEETFHKRLKVDLEKCTP
jgi:hypothetical protein